VDEYGRARQATEDNVIRCMQCNRQEYGHTRWEYWIPIAFPRPHWLRERSSLWR